MRSTVSYSTVDLSLTKVEGWLELGLIDDTNPVPQTMSYAVVGATAW